MDPTMCSPCPTPEQLLAFSLGDLPEEACERIAAHLDQCPVCESTAVGLEQSADTLIEQLTEPTGDNKFIAEPQFQQAMRQMMATVLPPEEPSSDKTPELGTLGEYQLLEKLGEGGMGAVYKARHTRLDKIVAIKVLPKDRTADPRAVARFEREMKAVGRLDHPNIVEAHDAREIEGTHFLVMRYVAGMDLGDVARRLGPLPIADACELVRQAALGLQCAFENGLVHRDIKPSNLMLARGAGAQPSATVKILDLGLALLDPGASSAGEVTSIGQIMGTADYIAPEQAFSAHEVDIRADIYSLGCTLYRLLAGRPPYTGPNYQTVMAKMLGHLQEPCPGVREARADVPDDVAAVVGRMMAKSRDDRFATPAAVAEALAPLAVGSDLGRLLHEAQNAGSAEARSVAGETCASSVGATHSTATMSAAPVPLPRPETFGGRARRWKILVATALGLAAMLLAVITIVNRHGTLVIESDDPNVQIAVKQNGEVVEIVDAQAGWKIGLKAGQYELSLQGTADRFQLDRDTVTVCRGETVKAKVAIHRAGTVAANADKPAPAPVEAMASEPRSVAPDRYDAFWRPGPAENVLPGLVACPAKLPGIGRWQIDRVAPRGRLAWGVRFSPNGKLLALGDGNRVRVLDATGSRLVWCFVGHAGQVNQLAFHPDGKWLASTSEDKTIRLWNVETGAAGKVIRGHREAVECVAWNGDGSKLASGGRNEDPAYRIWLADGTPGPVLPATVRDAWGSVSWSPDGKWVATRGPQIWSVDGKPGPALDVPDGTGHVAFSPDGNWLAVQQFAKDHSAGDRPGDSLRLIDTKTWKLHPSAGRAPVHWPNAIAWSPDSRFLASGWQSAMLYVWEVGNVNRAWTSNHFPSINGVDWSRDNSKIATAADYSVRIWEASGGQACDEIRRHYWQQVAGSADHRWLAAVAPCNSRINDIQLWAADGRAGPSLKGHSGGVRAIAWSPAGSRLASVAEDQSIRIWDPASGPQLVLKGKVGCGVQLAWSPDGNRLACGGEQGQVELWDLADPREERALAGGRGYCEQLAWRPDGKQLAARFWDYQAKAAFLFLWDGQGRPVPCPKMQTRFIAWSPDGKSLMICSLDKSLRVWHGGAEEPLTAWEVDGERFVHADWSPDGKWLASDSQDGAVLLWRPDQRPRQILKGTGSGRVCRYWRPDGRQLAVVRDDEAIQLWDLVAEKAGPVLSGEGEPAGEVIDVSWNADASELVSSHADGTLRRWDVSSGRLVETVVTLAGRVAFVQRGVLAVPGRHGGAIPDSGCAAYLSPGGRIVIADGPGGAAVTPTATSGTDAAQSAGNTEDELTYLVEQPTGGLKGYTPAEFRQLAKAAGWAEEAGFGPALAADEQRRAAEQALGN